MKTTNKTHKTTIETIAPIMMIFFLLFAATILFSSNEAQAQDATEIIRQTEDNMRGDMRYMEMSMQVVRPRYTREISMRSWSLGDDYSLVYVTAPARDQGTAFLKRGKEMWNYQPNIDRTIKMPPSMLSQSWMGSDFTNDDLINASSLADDYDHTFIRMETVDGHECYVIELVPHPDNPVVYEKSLYWISKEHYLPVKNENFDEYGDLVNTIYFRDIKQLGGRYIPAIMEMVPADRDNQRTVITTHSADFSIEVDQGFFSTQNLTNIR